MCSTDVSLIEQEIEDMSFGEDVGVKVHKVKYKMKVKTKLTSIDIQVDQLQSVQR